MSSAPKNDAAELYGEDGVLLVEKKNNPFMRSPAGGRLLSALMLPFFMLHPPRGFGVLTTTGRKSGKTRRKCIHAVRDGNRVYLVMIRPVVSAGTSGWVWNIRANPDVQLRLRGGTFMGVARELQEGEERQRARETYCEEVNPFDYMEGTFHRWERPTRARIKELHRAWFDSGIPLVVEL